MLNVLLASFCSFDGFCGTVFSFVCVSGKRFLWLPRAFSLAEWCAQQQDCFDPFSLRDTEFERIWESPGGFIYPLRCFSFWTFSHRELCCTSLGVHHHMVQAASSCCWGTWSSPCLGLSILWSLSSGMCSSVLDTHLGTCQLYPNLPAKLQALCLRTGPSLLSLIFYSVLVTV